MRTRCSMIVLLAGILAVAPAALAQTGPFARQTDGRWMISGKGFTAAVNAAGYLSSFKLGGVEAVGDPFVYQPNAKLAADDVTAVGDTLHVHLKGNGEAVIDYILRPDGLTISPTWKGGGYAEFRFNASRSLLGIELLNSKNPAVAGEATQFTDQGEVRGVPAAPSSRNQMVRFHYPGFNLHATIQAWGAPFNYESAGSIAGYTWGRVLMDGNRPFPLLFTIEKVPAGPTLPAVSFVPRTDRAASLYYVDEPCTWTLDLGDRKNWGYLMDAGVHTLKATWRLSDVHGLPVPESTGTADLSLEDAASHMVTLKLPGSGYYQVLFTLSDPAGKMFPSSFRTRFTAIHRIPGMMNRDDSLAGKGFSDYSIMGMIGIGGIRESHNVGEFFTNREPKGAGWQKVDGADPAVWMNIKALDDLFNTASAEAKRYGITWFFQANSRPAYANPTTYEAMAFALVTHCKDRCQVWEVENEPNFGYSPDNYITQCLTPFFKGAKRADPGCTVMGPACVSVKQTLEFMDRTYARGANQYLDAVSTHTYPGPGESWEQFGITTELEELRSWMQAHGDGAKKLWQTEQGYAWDNSPQTQSARYTVRQFLEGWRLGIDPDRQYYFYPQWHGFEDWYLQGSGERGSENSWLPGGAALRFLAENTHGLKFDGDLPSPYKGIFLSRFSGDTEDVVAAWTFDFAYSLGIQCAGLKEVRSFMGNPVPLPQDKPGVYSIPLSGEPVYIHLSHGAQLVVLDRTFGRNLAAMAAGGTAAASSETRGKPASAAIDGNWQLWEDVPGLPGRTAWQSGVKDPSPDRPDWLEVTFPLPRTVNRLTALCYLPAVNPSPRDFEFQVDAGGKWKTVAQGRSEFTWVLDRTFPPVTTRKVRMVVTKLNDGWQRDRRWMAVLMGPKATNYTDSKLLVSEFEAYGPETPDRVSGNLRLGTDPDAARHPTLAVEVVRTGSKAEGRKVVVRPPAGWTSAPSQILVADREGPQRFDVALQAPADMAAGSISFDLTLLNAAGQMVDRARATLSVPAPVAITPQTPSAVDEHQQPLVVTVKNTTAAPMSGTVGAEAPGLAPAPPQAFGPVAPGDSTTVNLTAPGLKLVGAPATVTYVVTAGGFITRSDQVLNVRGWQVIGPYPSPGGTGGFDIVYDPEKTIDFGKAYPVMNGQTAHWKPAFTDGAGFTDLVSLFNPHDNVVSYAVIYVKSPAERKAILSAGSDDGIKAWLNGQQIIADNATRGAAPGQDEAPVTLRSGWNTLLLKITQGGYGWGFYSEVLDIQHRPMTDLEYGMRPG